MKRISDIPKAERPREKLQQLGAGSLSDTELIAILLSSGTRKYDVMELSNRIIRAVDNNKGNPDLEELLSIDGVGPAKAMIISAALEFSRRRIRPEGMQISFPSDVLPLIQHHADRKQEHFLSISISGANEVIATQVVTIGLVNRSHVHPREVFADPITDRASAVIVAHNHLIGLLEPSKEDRDVTKMLKAAGKTLGIRLMDHIIFNKKGYYSFLEHDEMEVA
ncbi:MAG: DNA repair protein RadC [Deltaproteobacteria bacterium]|nr:DNA repair protein RadC [Deltaproteobacteria bacterium]